MVGAARFEPATPSLPGAGLALKFLRFFGNRAIQPLLKLHGFLSRLATSVPFVSLLVLVVGVAIAVGVSTFLYFASEELTIVIFLGMAIPVLGALVGKD